MMKKILVNVLVCLLLSGALAVHASPGSERIIFVGDSITGQGERHKKGWGHLIREALDQTQDDSPAIIMLGGSGQRVSSWINVEEKSRTKNSHLDAKNFDVKTELDRGGQTLVIMLGMNDVLSSGVQGTAKSIKGWKRQYLKLIKALKERVKPDTIALATITCYTEDVRSHKNQVIDKLNAVIADIATKNGYVVLPVGQTYKSFLAMGRERNPQYHITTDYVHPNDDGHVAIAVGMLEGLGKSKAKAYLESEYLPKIKRKASGKKPKLSYTIEPLMEREPSQTPQRFALHYHAGDISDAQSLRVRALAPKGWQVEPALLQGAQGTFELTGNPDQLRNHVKLQGKAGGQTYQTTAVIAAPWLVAWDIKQPQWQYRQPISLAQTITPIDQAIEQGKDFLKAPGARKGKDARKPDWVLYYPSLNYTGRDNPGSVDFASVSDQRVFEAGYGVRWIHSLKARKVKLKMNTRIFAGDIFLTVWLNQKKVYQDELTKKPGKKDQVEVSLRKGWNELVFKSNHRDWQWQNAIVLMPTKGDSLSDLRYATTKPAPGSD